MTSKVWIEEAGTVDTNVFPSLGEGRTFVVFSGGRSSGKTVWVKKLLDSYVEKKQEGKFPKSKSKFY